MFNPEFSIFDDWSFGKLKNLLKDIKTPKDLEKISLSLGEPQTNPPPILKEMMNKYSDEWRKYLPPNGKRYFRESVASYLERRYPKAKNLIDIDDEINPVPGTRAPLYQLGSLLKDANNKKTISLVTNPFYHAWRAGAMASGTTIHWMNATKTSDWLPNLYNLESSVLDKCSIMYICTPSNPHGKCASLTWLKDTINICRKHKVILCVDECYADIYRDNVSPPAGIIEAISELGEGFKGVVALHSLSKRSSAAGLRAGFMIGDSSIIAMYRKLIANTGVVVSEPQLRAAEALYNDDEHVRKNRYFYDTNFAISEKLLKVPKPHGGFFHFIPVKNDIEAAKHLWEYHAIKTMPGSFMANNTIEGNPGSNYLRLALVHEKKITLKALSRISKGLQEIK